MEIEDASQCSQPEPSKIEPSLSDHSFIKSEAPQASQPKQEITTESDYLKLFESYIYDDSNWEQCQQQPPRAKYRLIEDLTIMYFVGTDQSSFDTDTLGVKFFSQLRHAGFFPSRTVESLRDRYKRYLSCLRGSDIIKIGGWVIENGVIDAFLEFSFFFEVDRMEMVRKLEKIVKVKLSYSSDIENETEQQEIHEQHKKTEPVEENKSKIYNEQQQIIAEKFKFPIFFLRPLNQNRQKIWQFGPFNLFLNEQIFCSQSNYRDIEMQITTNFEGYRTVEKDLEKEEQLLQDQLERICEQFSLTKDQALDYLDAVSGNFKDLYYFLRNEDDSILWLEEDDMVLREAESMEEPAFQLLVRQKGKERIKSRLKYKNFVLSFNF